ncbi:MAG: sugar ABC transporter permease, partial [Oscillospiraceae bacterium]|nr:sugar ABC transporter permease [Oscillospiraceae bacterium]
MNTKKTGTVRELFSTLGRTDKIQEILMILPMFIGFCLFVVYPIFWIIRWAWFNYDGFTTPIFVGFDNFARAFMRDPAFWMALGNTAFIAGFKLILEIPIAVVLAAILSRKIRFSTLFRTSFFLPTVFSIAVVGLIFSIMFGSFNGVINEYLRALGLITRNVNFLGVKWNAMFVIVLVSLWTTFGLNMIYFLMGLQNIPKSLYECAEIDGANSVQQFFGITIPMIAPVMQLVIMLSVLYTIRMTDLILVLTNGAPGGSTEVVMTYIFKFFFQYGESQARTQYGYASAMAVITAIILGVMTFMYLHISRKMK